MGSSRLARRRSVTALLNSKILVTAMTTGMATASKDVADLEMGALLAFQPDPAENRLERFC